MRIPKQNYDDIERIIEFDFVRATEAAALNALPWLGRGEKEKADGAACDAIRGMFDLMNICGEVVIGEGIKDDAPGIFKGEQLGMWLPGAPQFDIALDPIDGTTNIAKGAPNSITCLAAATPEKGVKVALRDIPSFYMMKLAYGPDVIRSMKIAGIETLKLESQIEETFITLTKELNNHVESIVVMILKGTPAPPTHRRGNPARWRLAPHDQRRRHRGGHGPGLSGERDRSLRRDRRCTRSRASRGRDQMPRRRHAMYDVAARRKRARPTRRRRS
jgi:hypothetical protein